MKILTARTIFFALFLAPTFSGLSQEIIEDDPPIQSKKKYIGFELSPQLTDSYQTTKSEDHLYQYIVELNNQVLTAKFSYSGGVSFYFNINRRLLINTGIIYSNKGGKDYFDLTYFAPPAGSPDNVEHTYSFHYINLPVLLKVNLLDANVKFYSIFGVVPNFSFFSSTKTAAQYGDGTKTTSRTSGTIPFGIKLSGNIGFGLGFAINPHSVITFEPHLEYGIFDFSQYEINTHLWSSGIKFSYIRTIGK